MVYQLFMLISILLKISICGILDLVISLDKSWVMSVAIFELQHEISNNVVCATSNGSDQPAHMRSLLDQPAHMRSLIRAFASCLTIL